MEDQIGGFGKGCALKGASGCELGEFWTDEPVQVGASGLAADSAGDDTCPETKFCRGVGL